MNTNDSIPAYGSYMLYAASGKAPGTNTYVGYSFLSNSRAMTFCHPITGEFELYVAYKDAGDIWSAWKQVTLT